jgi:hypothetical protein
VRSAGSCSAAVILLAVLCWRSSAGASELLLFRNVLIEEPVSIVQINELKKKQAKVFRPGDRITAVLIFNPSGTEEAVEFQWAQQVGRVLIQQEKYTHRMMRQNPGRMYVAYSWVIFDPTFLDKLLGSRYAGGWQVTVLVGDRKEAEKHFVIAPD